MTFLPSVLGGALVALILRDIFHTLFHPAGQGGLSRLILVGTWRTARRLGGPRRLAELAGPLGLVAVIAAWFGGVVLGGALVYWPHMPDAFSYAAGLHPAARDDFLDAVYLSLTTTTTLGFGDIVPTAGWLRAAAPLQAMIGFTLLTAAVSWVLQVYPALNRRRTLATRLTALERSGVHDALRDADSPVAALLLQELAGRVAQARVDLTQYAETYYFRAEDPRSSLPAALPYALDLADIGERSQRGDLRWAAATLACALADLTELVGRQFLGIEGSVEEVLAAYAADHGESALLERHSDEPGDVG